MDPPITANRFLRVFLPLALVLASALTVYVRVELQLSRTRLAAQEELGVYLGASRLARLIEEVRRDVGYLANSPEISGVLANPSLTQLGELAAEFAAFSTSRHAYQQLRWIDAEGMERVRVEWVGGVARVVPRVELQDTSGQHFFAETMRLPPGETFVSPLADDAGRDAATGRREPMLRMATPLVDGAGQPRGILVVDYLGRHLGDEFRAATARIGSHVMLLGQAGDWLAGGASADEQGPASGPLQASLAARAPEVWRQIASVGEGQLVREDGIWTWSTVRPSRAGQGSRPAAAEAPSGASPGTDGYFWKVVGHLSSGEITAHESGLHRRLAVVVAILTLLAVWASWKSAQFSANRHAAREALRFANSQLERTVAERTHELSDRVAELHRANARLQQNDATLTAILSASLDGYAQIDSRGRIRAVNERLCQLSGYSREALLAMSVADLDAVEDRSAVDARLQRIVSTGRAQFESIHRHRSGHCWNVEVSALYEPTGEGRIHAFLRDISARKQIEQARLASERRFRDVASVSADWIWEVDENAVYTYVSDSVRTMLGYDPEDLIGKTPFDFMAPDEAARIAQEFTGIVAAKATFMDLRNEVIGKDGKVRVTLTNGVPILDEDGTLRGYRGVDRDFTARERMEVRIRQMAYVDSLTGLPNRRLFEDRLAQAMAASKRTGTYGALVFIDLDHFKTLNDRYGHDAGDALLLEAARRLKAAVRASDTVARLGGDEFVLVLTALSVDRANSAMECGRVCEKVAAALSEPCRIVLDGRPAVDHRVTASIGVCLFLGQQAQQTDLLRLADRAMYDAKAAGRNAVRFADDGLV